MQNSQGLEEGSYCWKGARAELAQWAVAKGKDREGESSSMGKAAAAKQPEPLAARAKEMGTETCWHKAPEQL